MKTFICALLMTLSAPLYTNAQATIGFLTYVEANSAGNPFGAYDKTKTVETGERFYAELWYAKDTAGEASLSPVSGSLVQWTYNSRVIIFPSNRRLEIPGTEGGDRGLIQLRVWKATATDWQTALSQNLPRGISSSPTIRLGGASADGTLFLPVSTTTSIGPFPIIPEPSSLLLVIIGAAAMVATASKRR